MPAAVENPGTDAKKKKTVHVEITSDLMCPWCWVGLRKLQEAQQLMATDDVDVQVSWKPFMLRPDAPKSGIPKGGTPASRVGARLRAAGEAVGIDFTGLTDRTPNTALFHATMKLFEQDPAKQTDFQIEAFRNYFTLGIYPDEAGLLKAAERAGVADAVSKLYEDKDRLARLTAVAVDEAQDASRAGISGVPTFAFNGDPPAFSGARDARDILRYLVHYANQE